MTDALVIVVGATASRKSDLAMGLAARLGGELCCCDSVQIYRGFVIGSAAPSQADQGAVAHHLYNILNPADPGDAGRYARLADGVIADVLARGKVPIVVGGTGLYVRALLYGLAPIPVVPPGVRERLTQELEANGREALFERLTCQDPVMAARIQGGAANTQRVLRALEVFEGCGQRLSALQDAHRPELRYRARILMPEFGSKQLANRIARRVRAMMDAGLVEEVRGLLAAGVPPDCRPMGSLGYRQVVQHLGGELTLEEAVEAVIRGHRRYAKRQRTWFNRLEGTRRLDATSDALLEDALAALDRGPPPTDL